MRTKIALLLFLLCISRALSQPDAYVISQRAFARLMPTYQSWSLGNGPDFNSVGLGLVYYQPITRTSSMSIRTGAGTIGGDAAPLQGLSDAQLSLNYYLERPRILLNVAFNLPSGKKDLNLDEFATSTLISNTVFNMMIPSFGSGFGVNPGIIWALPAGDRLVFGLGVSFSYKGAFRPVVGIGEYDPGDEVTVTGGIDIRMSEETTVSTDVIFTTYGKDKLEGEEIFASGNRIVANVRLRQYISSNELVLHARFRTKGKNELAVARVFVPETQRLEPNQLELNARYGVRVSSRFTIVPLAELRLYEETPSPFSGVTLFGLGVASEVAVSSRVTIPATVKYLGGSLRGGRKLTGLEAALGIQVTY